MNTLHQLVLCRENWPLKGRLSYQSSIFFRLCRAFVQTPSSRMAQGRSIRLRPAVSMHPQRNAAITLRASDGVKQEGGGIGGFFGALFGGGGNFGERDAMVQELTRVEGWDMKMQIGSEPARALGGTGTVAKGDSMTVNIGCNFRLEVDDGYDPPQGTTYVAGSSIFKEVCALSCMHVACRFPLLF